MQENESLDWVNRESRERLAPSITNPSWLVLRRRRELFLRWTSSLPASGLRVLDIGGRLQPYRPLLGTRVARYLALDPHRSPLVNVIATGERMPFPDNSFDLVICTQVLEYIPSPPRLIEEAHRVLKPGAHLFLSAPAVFPRDSEQDLWRFTSAGLAALLSAFGEVTIEPEGSTIVGIGRTLAFHTTLAKPAFMRRLLGLTVVPVINLGTVTIDAVLATSNDSFAVNYSAFAQK
jgi:SAM-dependent methyltransferase